MKEVEKLCKQIVKQSKDKDAKYFYGVEWSMDRSKPIYKAYIVFSKGKIPPMGIMTNSEADLIKGVKEYIKSNKGKDYIIKYHEAEIAEAEKTVFWHKEKIKEYEDTHSELPTE